MNIWHKICQICPLCKYTRKHNKGIKYHLFKKIETICLVCILARKHRKKEDNYCQKEIFIKENEKIETLISYYKKIVSTNERVEELKILKEKNNKKVVGIFCNFVPEELIYGAGCIPVRLCSGYYDTISPAEEILPRDICPLIKSSFGFKILQQSYFSICDLVIVPTTCDGKKKVAEILKDYLPVYILELPQSKNLKSVDTWLKEIKQLKFYIEKFVNTKINLKKLKETVLMLHKRSSLFRQLYNIKKLNPGILSGSEITFIIQACFYDDINRWIEITEQLCTELGNKIHNSYSTFSGVRLLLTGAPIIWPNFKLFNIIENTDAIVAIDNLCSGVQYLYNTVEIDEWNEESILKSIATKYLLPSICPCFTESNDRIDRTLNLIKEFNINGVIYHSLRLCQLYDIEIYRFKQALKTMNIPMIVIHTDYGQEDVEQIKTRIEAFLEMIKEKC